MSMQSYRRRRNVEMKTTYWNTQVNNYLALQGNVVPFVVEEKKERAVPPIGSVTAYISNVAPEGWLLCDGSEVSRLEYKELFAIMGTTFGTGDGVDTFNLPDYRGAFLRGTGTNSGNTNYAGPSLNSAQVHATEKHAHTITDAGHGHDFVTRNDDYNNSTHSYPDHTRPSAPEYDSGSAVTWSSAISSHTTGISVDDSLTGGNASDVETRPFNFGVWWIVKF